ncbi:MAG: FHA domain-containing protein [Planctomycetaceae bacterium]
MPHLDVQSDDGEIERRDLSPKQPITIGSQPLNDLVLAGDEIGPVHCRIGWNKTGYEVTATGHEGVDVNGRLVQHAFLRNGDVLRIGRWDLVFQDSDGTRLQPRTASGT